MFIWETLERITRFGAEIARLVGTEGDQRNDLPKKRGPAQSAAQRKVDCTSWLMELVGSVKRMNCVEIALTSGQVNSKETLERTMPPPPAKEWNENVCASIRCGRPKIRFPGIFAKITSTD